MARPHNFKHIVKLPPVEWMPGDLLKAMEVAEICNVTIETVERWRVNGLIMFVNIPNGEYRYPKLALYDTLNPMQNKKGQVRANKPALIITQSLPIRTN